MSNIDQGEEGANDAEIGKIYENNTNFLYLWHSKVGSETYGVTFNFFAKIAVGWI